MQVKLLYNPFVQSAHCFARRLRGVFPICVCIEHKRTHAHAHTRVYYAVPCVLTL